MGHGMNVLLDVHFGGTFCGTWDDFCVGSWVNLVWEMNVGQWVILVGNECGTLDNCCADCRSLDTLFGGCGPLVEC